jgi:hypothetical protein
MPRNAWTASRLLPAAELRGNCPRHSNEASSELSRKEAFSTDIILSPNFYIISIVKIVTYDEPKSPNHSYFLLRKIQNVFKDKTSIDHMLSEVLSGKSLLYTALQLTKMDAIEHPSYCFCTGSR